MKQHSQRTELLAQLYTGNPGQLLARAHALAAWLREHAAPSACGGGQPTSNPLMDTLPQLRQAADNLARLMQALGLGENCRLCAARPGGGCCSAYMAANSDAVLITLNLLLDVKVQLQVHTDDACCFLGADGCLFIAKPIFCLNYYCRHLQENIPPDAMRGIQVVANRVLSLQNDWENKLLALLRTHCTPFLS